MIIQVLLVFLAAIAAQGKQQLLYDPKYRTFCIECSESVPLNLAQLYNNRGFGINSNESNFDGNGNAFPAENLPGSTFQYSGIKFDLPTYKSAGNDNVIALGQSIKVPAAKYAGVHVLASSHSGIASGSLIAKFSDGSSFTNRMLVRTWWNWPYPAGGALIFPSFLTNSGINNNHSNIFYSSYLLDPRKELVSLTLPSDSKGKLHIFSITLNPISKKAGLLPHLEVKFARSTQKWIEGTNKTQIVEITISNTGASFVLRHHSLAIQVQSPGIRTVRNAIIKRLAPGDQTTVQVGIELRNGYRHGHSALSETTISGHHISSTPYVFNGTYGILPYEASFDSIYSHETPNWFEKAKYGIFIHWGVYAVPGWGNSGKNEQYAEWYWWWMNQGPNSIDRTYQYHLEKYGPEVVYDDFIANFSAAAFDPKEWVDIFTDAGAKYFVSVSKHHDGYALFDLPQNVSRRTSVVLPPHRNLLKELFDAATRYQPELRRGTYFSIPEWFHPDYRPHGFGMWPGGNATDPYFNRSLPYTGYVPVQNYLSDVVLPSMQTLASMGTDIMWCDIGGPNLSLQFASEWYNQASAQNRQVTMNSRCGVPGDFDTPEYARYGAIQRRKWESNLGMDPKSYGYNRATPLQAYMNATTIVTSLVDIVAKNGNFLLDIGPRADGSILEVEKQNLREAGSWIRDHEEAIFNTTFWSMGPEDGPNIRFTVSEDAFYIISIRKPDRKLLLNALVPWINGDSVTVVGGRAVGTSIPAKMLSNNSLVLELSDEVIQSDRFAWVFKIPY